MARITIKDIARESGYSIGTVSRALNNAPGVSSDAKEAVFKVVKKYGFEINPNAKFLKQKNPRGVAVLIKGMGNRFFEDLAGEMIQILQKRGYAVSRFYAGEEENEIAEAAKLCYQRSLEGLILLGADRQNLKSSFGDIKIPTVLSASSSANLPYENLSCVCTNDTAAAQEAVEYLFATGHKQIALIGGERSRSSVYSDRYYGTQYAFYSRGVPFSESERYLTVQNTYEGGYEGFKELKRRIPDLDAVFALSDTLAIGVMRAAMDMGIRIPEELSVIGFDGLNIGRFISPRLSTVQQDVQGLAKLSVDRLIENMENQEPEHWREVGEVPYTMKMRESTRKHDEAADYMQP